MKVSIEQDFRNELLKTKMENRGLSPDQDLTVRIIPTGSKFETSFSQIEVPLDQTVTKIQKKFNFFKEPYYRTQHENWKESLK